MTMTLMTNGYRRRMTMMPINRTRLAAQHDRDRRKIEATGLKAARLIMADIARAAVAAEKMNLNPVQVVRERMRLMQPILTDGIVSAHLQGWLRSMFSAQLAMRTRRKKAITASVYDETLAFLKERTRMNSAEIAALRAQYGDAAFAAIDQASTRVEQAIQRTLLRVKGENLIRPAGIERFGKAMYQQIDGLNNHLVETVYRTQVNIGYSVGQQRANASPEIDEILFGYTYRTVGDDRVRPEHEAMDGVTAPKDDPIWKTWFPPAGWNCRCTAIEIYRGEGAQYERTQYPDPTIEVDGDVIPVLPDEGFRVNFADVFAR